MNTRLKTAWLIRWGFNGPDEDERLREHGINNKIVDFFNTRKSFDVIQEYTKNLYRSRLLAFSEKLYLESYSRGKKRHNEMFGVSIPLFTHYKSDVYRKLIKTLDKHGIDSKEYATACECWKNYPEYIIVGHNPYLEARKVFNLEVAEDPNAEELLQWEEITVQGERIKKNYKPINLSRL